MKRIRQIEDFDCGVAAVAMLLDGRSQLTRKRAYQKALNAIDSKKRTRISQLASALEELGRPLRAGRMEKVPGGGLPALTRDALVRVRFTHSKSLHWMVWDQRRQCLLDPETKDYHWSEYHVLHQIEVAE